jgi:hypothetical protein
MVASLLTLLSLWQGCRLSAVCQADDRHAGDRMQAGCRADLMKWEL